MVRLKRVIIIFLIILASQSVFANSQKYYPVSSEEWRAVNNLCIYAGVMGPTSNGPVTVSQLEVALNRVEQVFGENYGPLVELRSHLHKESALIRSDFGALSLIGKMAGEFYFQSNPITVDKFDNNLIDPDRYLFIKDSLDRDSFLGIEAEITVKNFFYSRLVYDFGTRDYENGVWDKKFSHNLEFNNSANAPYDSGVSIGGSNFTFIAAKGRRSMGRGYTGNTAIGDVFNYQEFIKTGAFSDVVSLYIGMTNFDSSHFTNYTSDELEKSEEFKGFTKNPFKVDGARFGGYKSIRYETSLEVNLFKNFGFTFSLMTLIDSESSFDLRGINPFYILHNLYNYNYNNNGSGNQIHNEANNFLTFDITYIPIKKFQLYFQFSMDQFQEVQEVDHYLNNGNEEIEPNAFGILANITYVDKVKDGTISAYGEFVYNSPGLYLNQLYYDGDKLTKEKKDDNYCWAQDYLVGYDRVTQRGDDVTFAGYKYGPDVIVGSVGVRYSTLKQIDVLGRVLYIAHGEKGRGTKLENYTFDGINKKDSWKTKAPTGIVEHTAAVTIEGQWQPSDWCKFYLGFAYAHIWNCKNEKNVQEDLVQASVGVSLKLDFGSVLHSIFKKAK